VTADGVWLSVAEVELSVLPELVLPELALVVVSEDPVSELLEPAACEEDELPLVLASDCAAAAARSACWRRAAARFSAARFLAAALFAVTLRDVASCCARLAAALERPTLAVSRELGDLLAVEALRAGSSRMRAACRR
jgi:hypothetical protein